MKSVVIDSLRRELLIRNKKKPTPSVFSQNPFKKNAQNSPKIPLQFHPPKHTYGTPQTLPRQISM
jgi:hypothetical protein